MVMKNNIQADVQKLSINTIIANQHPVTICWFLASFVLFATMYVYTSMTF